METSTNVQVARLQRSAFRFDTLPNRITAVRLMLAVGLFVLIAYEWWTTALVLFLLALASDLLDGYLARKRGEITAIGRILDPFADKIVIVGAFIFLMPYPVDLKPWMVTLIVARELLVSSIRSFLESARIPFGADWGGKIKMALQSLCVAWILATLSPGGVAPWVRVVRVVLIWLTVLATALSGLNYFRRAVHIIQQMEGGRADR